LEVILDSKLNFNAHIQLLEGNVAKAVGILNKLRSIFPKSALLFLYYALVHLHFLYALPLWSSTYQTYAAFTLSGFDDQERNLTFVKTTFQVLKLKLLGCSI